MSGKPTQRSGRGREPTRRSERGRVAHLENLEGSVFPPRGAGGVERLT